MTAQRTSRTALAVAAHPDDIEFYMAGTLLLLKQAGWEIHCLNLSSGNLGSATMKPAQAARARRDEAREAARILGAQWHPPFARDLEIFYDDKSLRRLAAIIREVQPSILLTHPPEDYMEDHMNTCRLTVTAAFARGMPNYKTTPPRPTMEGDITIYHATPHLLRNPMGRVVVPEIFVDATPVMKTKRRALGAHRSQKQWLDESQGMDSYLRTMEDLGKELGRLSRVFDFAEGWWRHFHPGFCQADSDPLPAVLGERAILNPFKEKL